MKMNKILFNRWIKWILVPLILFIFGCLLVYFYVYRTQSGLLVLVYPYGKKELTHWKTAELMSGEKIKGAFRSPEENLGIIAIRFKTYTRINSDILIFRLKEKGEENWHYQNKYRVDQFQPDQLFTFGFPIINNSKYKDYIFEIESTMGEKEDAIGINFNYPVFVSKHKFLKEKFFQNKNEILIFSIKKITSLGNENLSQVISEGSKFIPNYLSHQFSDLVSYISERLTVAWTYIGWFLVLLTYFSPLILYALWQAGLKNYYGKIFILFLAPSLFIFITIFLLKISDLIIMILISFWIFTLHRYRLPSIISFIFSLFFLALSLILVIFNQDDLAKSAGIWTFLFLTVGIGQQFLAIRNGEKNKINLDTFIEKTRAKLVIVIYFVYRRCKKLLPYSLHALSFIIILFMYKAWFLSGIITGGDFWPGYASMYKNISLFPYAWNWGLINGMGGNSTSFLWFFMVGVLSTEIFGIILHFPIELVERFGIFYPYLIAGIFSSIFLFKKILPNNSFWILSPLIFILNTYILMLIGGGQIFISLSYVLAPLILYSYIRLFLINKLMSLKKIKYSILTGLLLALQMMLDIRIAYVTMIAVVIYFLITQVWVNELTGSRVNSKYTVRILFNSLIYNFVIPIGIAFLIHAFWILPVIFAYQNPVSQLGLAYSTTGAVKFFSFARFENSISLLHPNWPENIFGKTYFLRPEFLILPILAFSSALFIKKEKKERKEIILFFLLLALIGAFLAKGINEPFGEVYLWLFNNFPGFIMFRDPTKWYVLIALSYSILIPYSISKIYEFLKLIFSK